MDNFYLEKIFPEPSKLFEFEFKDLDSICKDCIYVFDTNVLFVPFLVSNKGFKDYKKIATELVKNKRLVIPARVAREFAKNRGENIKTLFRKLQEARERLGRGGFDLDSLPVFEDDTNYKRIKEIESEVNKFRTEYREKIDELSVQIKKWNWNDPVSLFYKKLWTNDSIIEMKIETDKVQADLKFRQEHQIAPGYKDKNKVDGGIGDLIIWQTIMEISKDRQKDIVFVTNEEKNDWFYNEKNTSLYPKFELFDEFRRFTAGHSISIINFEQFLVSQKASEETIKEIKELRATSGFLKIEKERLIQELQRALAISKDRDGGFVGSKFFVETLLADKLFDIATSWETINELVNDGIIEIYSHIDEKGLYPPISALRFTKEE
jgi:hypothetical protein